MAVGKCGCIEKITLRPRGGSGSQQEPKAEICRLAAAAIVPSRGQAVDAQQLFRQKPALENALDNSACNTTSGELKLAIPDAGIKITVCVACVPVGDDRQKFSPVYLTPDAIVVISTLLYRFVVSVEAGILHFSSSRNI
jgi:hypothetical protein